MKNKLLSLGLLTSIVVLLCFAFAPPAPDATKYEAYSQMWNTSNTYYGTINTTTLATLGSQLDTGTNTTVLNLYTAALSKGKVNADTFQPSPLKGWGSITLTSVVLKCTNSPTVTVTPVASNDGINWASIPGVTAATVSPTSLTVPVVSHWVFPLSNTTFGGKAFRYYGLQYAGSATSTYSAQAFYLYQRPLVYSQ